MARVTHDTFLDGNLRISQPGSGYRYSLDAVLLAALPNLKPGQSLLDLGTGCGIIPLILAFRNREARISGVEVQSELARLAAINVENNGLQDRVRIIHADLRHLTPEMVSGPVDWIVSNPPYRRAVSGRVNPDTQRALARHEIKVNLHQLVSTARRLLKTGGRFAIIYPSERAVDLFSEMRPAGLEPKWLQCVHSQADGDAKLVLVQAVMGGKPGLKIERPLVVYGPDGRYSAAVKDMMVP
ncbi:MAG: tRNA1(Val) (adenine(37)-N6)-methyltransferase [Desulfobacteraceae bacterium]